jgi:hypothetical protein
MPLLFSYGTLQRDDIQLATFGRRLNGQPDELVGYEPSLVKIEDAAMAARLGKTHHANVIATGKAGSRAPGTVFEITDAELASCDGYEAPFSYARVLAKLVSGKETWVYVHEYAMSATAPRR